MQSLRRAGASALALCRRTGSAGATRRAGRPATIARRSTNGLGTRTWHRAVNIMPHEEPPLGLRMHSYVTRIDWGRNSNMNI